MIKKLLALVVLVVLVLVVGVIGIFFYIDSIAKAAIERGGSYALGVPTTLRSASVGILGGTFSMSGLNVSNPPGYDSPSFLTMGSAGVAVSLDSLRQPVVELPRLSFDDLTVSLQKKNSKANYAVILDNLNKLKSSGSAGGSSSNSDKRFVIKDLTLKNIRVGVDLVGGPGKIGDLTKLNIPIQEIHLQNVGQTGTGVGGTGVTMEQLASIIVQAVLGAAAEKGGGILPADMLGDLQGGLANLGGLDKIGMQVLADPKGAVQKIGTDAANKALEQGKKQVDDAAKKAIDLIPGMKKDPKK